MFFLTCVSFASEIAYGFANENASDGNVSFCADLTECFFDVKIENYGNAIFSNANACGLLTLNVCLSTESYYSTHEIATAYGFVIDFAFDHEIATFSVFESEIASDLEIEIASVHGTVNSFYLAIGIASGLAVFEEVDDHAYVLVGAYAYAVVNEISCDVEIEAAFAVVTVSRYVI